MKGCNGLGLGLKAAAVVALALIGGLLASSQVSAQDEAVSISRVTVAPGGQGSVQLEALNMDAPGLGAWTIDILYDPAVITPVACTPQQGAFCNPDFTADRVRVVGARATGLQGDTTLASITFRCEREGASALTPIVQQLADATTGGPQEIDADTESGSVTCPAVVPPAPGVLGDVDCNGIVNSRDAALVLQYHAGLITSLPCRQNADVNGDGRIDSRDATLILQYDAGLIIAFS